MINNFWKLKICAFLHDPPEKAFYLTKKDGHETIARKYLDALGLKYEKKELLDWIAASMDRLPFSLPRPFRVDEKDYGFSNFPIITHILSGEKLTIGAESAFDKVRKDLEVIKTKSDEEKFLFLWRLLKDKIIKNANYKTTWSLIPADTRIPDHSIWNHMAATSALVSTLDYRGEAIEPALLIFSLSPVQSFIVQSRKTQDLWIGSLMLSWLTWNVIFSLVKEFGPDTIVYPNLIRQPFVDHWLFKKIEYEDEKIEASIPTIPNTFVAIVRKDKETIQKLKENLNNVFKKIANEIWEFFKPNLEKCLNENLIGMLKEKWDRQIKDFWRPFIVMMPWSVEKITKESKEKPVWEAWENYKLLTDAGDEDRFNRYLIEFHGLLKKAIPNIPDKKLPADIKAGFAYPIIFELTQRFHATRKNIRNFEPSEEPAFKCTLCGQREALSPYDKPERKKLQNFWEKLRKENEKLEALLSPNEILCTICLIKRLAVEDYFEKEIKSETNCLPPKPKIKDPHFASTSEIATIVFKEEIIKKWDNLKQEAIGFAKKVDNFRRELLIRTDWYPGTVPKLYKDTNVQDYYKCLDVIKGKTSGDKDKCLFLLADGQWFFEEAFSKERLRKDYFGFKPERDDRLKRFDKDFERYQPEAVNALKRLKDKTTKLGISLPSTYYALLYMDGDEMGKWLSGENAPKVREALHPEALKKLESIKGWENILCLQRPLSPAMHNAISSALRDFSLEFVRYVIEKKFPGRLVYAGGDDVLAFVPIQYLFKVMHSLRFLFSGEKTQIEEIDNDLKYLVKGFVEKNGRVYILMGNKASASIGVTIAHYLHPLRTVITETHKALKEAKKVYKRNAFVFNVLKRSGVPITVGCKWRFDHIYSLLVLDKLQEAFQVDGPLSRKFPYDLRNIIQSTPFLNKEAFKSLLKRFLIHHWQNKDENKRDKIINDLLAILEGIYETYSDNTESLKPLKIFTDLLFVPLFISRGGRE